MTEPTLEEIRQAIREGRATQGLPTDEEIRQAADESLNQHELPGPRDVPLPWPYQQFEPTRLRTIPQTSPPPAQPPRPHTPSPIPSQSGLPRYNSVVEQLSSTLLGKLGILVLALVFVAAPVGIMALWAPIFNHNQSNLLVDLIGLGLGIGCLAWLCAGFAAVLGALGNLFSD
jgi:hypothetical protein